MRYGLIPQTPEEENALQQSPHACALLDPFVPIVAARAVIAFVQLGLAQALTEKSKSATALAGELNLRRDGVRPLLRVLVALGYAAIEPCEPEAKYALSPLSRATLVKGGPAPLDAWVAHQRIHWRFFSTLEDILSSEGVRDLHHHLHSEQEWAIYQQAMLQTARPVAETLAGFVPPPPGRELLLDLGGSHGLYGWAICRRFKPMRSRVVELPEALDHAKKVGEEEGIGDLVTWEPGDILNHDLGEQICDVVFMGNIAHHFGDEDLVDLLSNVQRALKPGGVIAIWDMAPPPEQSNPDLIADGFSLMFYLSSGSTCRSPEATVQLLNDAGFSTCEVHRGMSPTHLLVTAKRG